ncbi:MAG: glycosyltransferase family 4 protein [Elusimicrobiaceae bacterium]|nr:glycosyltransferase family 4 protein [Elusimicrobiaceae bacterium]
MTKKNILIFLNTYVPGYKSGGPVQAIKNLVENLGESYNFYVVTRDRDFGETNAYPNIEYGVFQQVGKAKVMYLAPRERNFKNYLNIINQTDFALFYLQSFWNFKFSILPLMALLKSAKRNLPVLIHPRGEFYPGALKQKAFKKRFVLLLWKISGLYKKVFFNVSSEEEKQNIIELFGKDCNKQIKIAMDFPKQYPIIDYNKEFSLPLKLVFLARIDPKKNLLFLIEIVKKLKIEVLLDIYASVSDQEYWQKCQNALQNTSKNIAINYKGILPHNQIQEVLSKYDLYCFLTKGENFGYTIHEALASALPVIISDKTIWHDLAKYNAGWEIPLSKPQEFIEKIKEYQAKTDKEKLAMRKGALAYAQAMAKDEKILNDNKNMFDLLMEGRC